LWSEFRGKTKWKTLRCRARWLTGLSN
jgi:hypothetical protein